MKIYQLYVKKNYSLDLTKLVQIKSYIKHLLNSQMQYLKFKPIFFLVLLLIFKDTASNGVETFPQYSGIPQENSVSASHKMRNSKCLQNKKFDLYAKGLSLNLQSNQITLFGCNIHTIKYELNHQQFSAPLISSTQRACQIDNDNAYISAIMKTAKISDRNQLKDQYQNIVLILKSKQQRLQENLGIKGDYIAYLPPLLLSTTGSELRIQGCNRFNYKYSLQLNKLITTPLSQTQKACSNQYDNIFVQSLQRSPFITITGNSLWCSFSLQQTNQSTSKTLFAIPKPQQIQSKLLPGEYKLLYLLGTSLSPIQVIITEQRFSFKGCNMISFNYKTSKNKQIQFNLFRSTKKACKIDNDQQYISAFTSVSYFQYQDGQLILTDKTNKIVYSQTIGDTTKNINYKILKLNQQPFNQNIKITMNGNTLSVKGCNHHITNIKYLQNNTIQIGLFQSTLQSCKINNDYKIIKILTNSNKLSRINQNRIIFYGKNNQELLQIQQQK